MSFGIARTRTSRRWRSRDSRKIGIIRQCDVLDATVARMEKAYPAYFGSYERFGEIRQYVDRFENLFLIGRNGMHRYNNQDHSMLTAMMAVDNIIAGKTDKAALWEVNTEMDYHEEKTAPESQELHRQPYREKSESGRPTEIDSSLSRIPFVKSRRDSSAHSCPDRLTKLCGHWRASSGERGVPEPSVTKRSRETARSLKEYFSRHHKARKPSFQPIFFPSL